MSDKFQNKYRIESTRKPDWDYSSSGWYFVTICCQYHNCYFGDVIDGQMKLNECGQMVDKWWQELLNKYHHIELEEYVIMPNHIHGIVTINNVETGLCARLKPATSVETGLCARLKPGGDDHIGSSLHDIVGWFKTMTTNEYIQNVKNKKWSPFHKHLWQPKYHDRIIRNEFEYSAKVEYILNNPAKWDEDESNPKSTILNSGFAMDLSAEGLQPNIKDRNGNQRKKSRKPNSSNNHYR